MKPKAKKEEEEGEGEVTFIPGNWTHSTAVPVAFERNSAKVSSAMDKSLAKEHKEQSTTSPETHEGKKLKTVEKSQSQSDSTNGNYPNNTYPAGLASLGGC